MSTEIDLAFAWLESTLSGDSTLTGYAPGGLWRTFAKPGTTAPYTIMNYQDGTDNVVFGGSRAYSEMHFRVVIVGPAADMQAILNGAARIDTLLTLATQTNVTGGKILASYRTQPVSMDELVEGEVWNQTGGVYCVMVKAS